MTGDLAAFHEEISDQIRITHTRAFGANGYVDRPFLVLKHRLNPNRKRVTLRAMDIAGLDLRRRGLGVRCDPRLGQRQRGGADAVRLRPDDDYTIPSDCAPAKEWR